MAYPTMSDASKNFSDHDMEQGPADYDPGSETAESSHNDFSFSSQAAGNHLPSDRGSRGSDGGAGRYNGGRDTGEAASSDQAGSQSSSDYGNYRSIGQGSSGRPRHPDATPSHYSQTDRSDLLATDGHEEPISRMLGEAFEPAVTWLGDRWTDARSAVSGFGGRLNRMNPFGRVGRDGKEEKDTADRALEAGSEGDWSHV